MSETDREAEKEPPMAGQIFAWLYFADVKGIRRRNDETQERKAAQERGARAHSPQGQGFEDRRDA